VVHWHSRKKRRAMREEEDRAERAEQGRPIRYLVDYTAEHGAECRYLGLAGVCSAPGAKMVLRLYAQHQSPAG
jgi:hypothetical protein